jgi:hypothetical protein
MMYKDRITINGVDYQRTGTIKVNDDYRNVFEAVGFDLDRLIQDAKEIQADYAQQGLTHNSLENEGDYFDVGYYITMQIGQWNKPYQLVA